MDTAVHVLLFCGLLPSLFDAEAKTVPSGAIASDAFGTSVAVSGDLIIVGTPASDDACPGVYGCYSGSAHAFRRSTSEPNHWQEVAALTPSNLSAGDSFGDSVAISNDVAIVGATGDDDACPEDDGCNSGAAYLFQINDGGAPTETQPAKLTASNAAEGDWFGFAVSISGDTAIVGAPRYRGADPDQATCTSGGVYVFRRDRSNLNRWAEVAILTPSDSDCYGYFGSAVSISGDTLIVGAYRNDRFRGAAIVFRRPPGSGDVWEQVAMLTTESPEPFDCFGSAVSVSGDYAMVGALCPGRYWRGPGMAHIFGRDHGGPDHWGEVTSLTIEDEELTAAFGRSVSIRGDTAVVGAPRAYGTCAGFDECHPGATYVFQRNEGGPDNWERTQVLSASDAADGDQFGASVAVGSGIVVIGAPEDDDAGWTTGAAYVLYQSECGNGVAEGPEECDDPADSATCDVDCTFAVCGDGLLNESAGEVCDGTENQACAGLPCRNDCTCRPLTCGDGIRDPGEACDGIESEACGTGRCTSDCLCRLPKPIDTGGDDCRIDHVETLSASDAEPGDGFGVSVSVSRTVAVVGVPWSDDGSGGPYECCSGSAYVFWQEATDPDRWIETAKLVASDGSMFDWFGSSVAVDGNTAVIGANGDDDACAPDIWNCNSGAAYIFARSNISLGDWSESAKLSASDAGANAFFGRSVAISGDTIVIGAPGSYSRDPQGAAYVYQRRTGEPPTWIEVAKLTAWDGMTYDRFGSVVAIHRDTVVVGAPGSDGACRGYPYCQSGSVYVFQRNLDGADHWSAAAKLTASDAGPEHRFGTSVSVHEDTVIIGAPGNDHACPGALFCRSGAAYIFERDRGGANRWRHVAKIVPSDAAPLDAFGRSVSITRDAAVVTAFDGEIGGQQTGSAYVFGRRHGGNNVWGEVMKLNASEHDREHAFGSSVSADGDAILIGAPYWRDIVARSGGVHVFSATACTDTSVAIPMDRRDERTSFRSAGSPGSRTVIPPRASDLEN